MRDIPSPRPSRRTRRTFHRRTHAYHARARVLWSARSAYIPWEPCTLRPARCSYAPMRERYSRATSLHCIPNICKSYSPPLYRSEQRGLRAPACVLHNTLPPTSAINNGGTSDTEALSACMLPLGRRSTYSRARAPQRNAFRSRHGSGSTGTNPHLPKCMSVLSYGPTNNYARAHSASSR